MSTTRHLNGIKEKRNWKSAAVLGDRNKSEIWGDFPGQTLSAERFFDKHLVRSVDHRRSAECREAAVN